MATDESLTLFRCGVCDSMFQTANECYAHVITHDAPASGQADAEVTEQTIETVDPEPGEHLAPDLNVLAAASDVLQKSSVVDFDASTVDIANVLSGESGIQIHIEEQEGETEPSTISYTTLEELKVGGDIVLCETPVVANTNEDLDIADILINIKQEKVDSDTHSVQTEVVEQEHVDQPKLVKILKNALPKDEVVRRKRRGDVLNTNESNNYHSCKICGKRYAILKSLKHHEKTHNIDRLLYCNICNKGFVKPSELKIHQKIHLTDEEKKNSISPLFKCKYCDKEYTIEKSLKHHEKVHELGKRYMCGTCNKTFFKPSDMQRHLMIHKPLARCYVCKKAFRDKEKLEHHVRSHPELMMSGHKKVVSLKSCRYCGKTCSTFSQLCNHIRTHTKKKPFPCDVCSKTFNRVSNMKLHRRLHSGLKPFECTKCDAKFADVANRNRHFKKYHTDPEEMAPDYIPRMSKIPVVSDLPPAPKIKVKREDLVAEVMSAYRDLDKNYGDHPNIKIEKTGEEVEKNLNVIECRELAGIPQAIKNLISGNAGDDGGTTELSTIKNVDKGTEQVYVVFEDNPSVCYVVEYEGTTPSLKLVKGSEEGTSAVENQDLSGIGLVSAQDELGSMSHVEIEEVDQDDADDCLPLVFEQDVCSDTDSRSCIMNPDYVVLKSQQEKKLSQLQKRFPCSTCGSKFAHRGSLKFHMRIHTKEGVMNCNICNAEFYRKSRLRIHMRDHTGEKPYKCSVCDKAFKVSYELTIHMREHTGRDTVPCDHCDRVFLTQRAYNAHMRDQSTIKPFSCRMCGKLFKRSDQRRRHMLTHFDGTDLPFKCHKCERCFGDSSNRKRHIIKAHGVEAMESLPKKRVSLSKHIVE